VEKKMSTVENLKTTSPATELERRLQRLEDIEAIRNLFLEYGRLADTKDWGGYSELFVETGTFDSPHSVGTVTGVKEIRERLGGAYGDDPADAVHLFHNIEVNVNGDRATARSVWTYMRPGKNGYPPQVLMSGNYEDVLLRTSTGWKFEIRK
jgi:hypothetical protein